MDIPLFFSDFWIICPFVIAWLYYFLSAPIKGNSTASADQSCCASCGIEEIDDIKLRECDDCDLVRYCSIKCQKEHRPKHVKECKRRRDAALRDKLLFKQPESTHRGDCPICCLPMPLELGKSTLEACCSTTICNGCVHANMIREVKASLNPSCPFCRNANFKTKKERVKHMMKRIEVNDPVALCHQGAEEYDEGNFRTAFEYWKKAVNLGDVEAHYQLSIVYHDGKGVKKADEGKEMHHLEEAAIGGHPHARHGLGRKELENGNVCRAMKHFIIAAEQGFDGAIKMLMEAFKEGLVEKDALTSTLRAHQAAVNETKSPQRKEAEEFWWEANRRGGLHS